ncbi:MAG TPA: AAA family ATPase [Ktedonobacteraceae bacterium]|nr:AAA family ATPase [Ktedonobacteraceae bacterium]
MAPRDLEQWQQTNKVCLLAHLERLRCILQHAHEGDAAGEESATARAAPPALPSDTPSALDTLCEIFRLSPFERDILLLCAAVELDSEFPQLCAQAQGDAQRDYASFSLALAALPGATWEAIAPGSPLRRWRLIEIEAGRSLTRSPLRIDERILHYLVGISYLDQRLAGLFHPLPVFVTLAPSHQQIAREIATTWTLEASATGALPVVQLCGPDAACQRSIAAAACSLVDHDAVVLSASALPVLPDELETLLLLWTREAALSDLAMLLDCRGVDTMDAPRRAAITRLVETKQGLLILASPDRWSFPQHSLLTFDVRRPTTDERAAIWQSELGQQAAGLNGHIHALAAQFHLNEQAIHAACAGALGRLASVPVDQSPPTRAMHETLWDMCRVQARPVLDDLAQRIEPSATWADLIIPDAQRTLLHEIASHVRYRSQVYETWGFAGPAPRGAGISALFVGASGVGKTLAAEVLAHELNLDLYRIDLSAVVSKYIGETEKNLRRVFDAAEEGGAILLFDEADALFGKRSEVKDSHDRYANIEISYLLQRMETYQGLAILTTNMKDTLDGAFLRRLRFIVQFPFPDGEQRAAIWRRMFPGAAPTEGLDMEKLAQLNVAGGNIRSISLNAAFIAAAAGEPIQMHHVLRATRYEYSKLERSLTSAEVQGWD